MTDFGKRLKEERERIGVSQARLAEACGVGKTAQYTYERGVRQPSLSYMEAAEKLGVDSYYVFTGTRTGKDWSYARAYSSLLYSIEMYLGLEEGTLELLCSEYVTLAAAQNPTGDGLVCSDDWSCAVIAWLGTSTKPYRCVDPALLASLLESVEQSAENLGVSLSTEKRVRIALSIYQKAKPQKTNRFPNIQEFSSTGEVRRDEVDNAVKLAAG